MKKFFEEYGFIILTCVVVIALVGIAIGVKPLMASSISNITNSWGSEAKESLNDAWNEDGSSGSQEEDKTQVTPISEDSCIGKYADIDGNGTVDGVIFADLAIGGSGTSFSNVTYSYTKSSNLKEYYVSKTATDDFGEQEVISLVDGTTGNDRFYVMALDDVDSSTHSWYYSATISDYSTVTSDKFGSGKQNTTTMIEKWNAPAYGEQNSNDMWGVIKTQATNGWFVPSISEWATFAGNLNITSSDYSTCGLSNYYWSSSLRNSQLAYDVNFYCGCMSGYDLYGNRCVRLATTF